MIISRLKIENLRNIENLDLELSPGINLFTGTNGAGKTSILEAIYLLSRNKSFRSLHTQHLIKKSKSYLLINASCQQDDKTHKSIGLLKTKTKTKHSINGKKIYKSSSIAKQILIGTITSNIHHLIEGGPVNRRRYLDWVVFHVEPEYLNVLQKYNYVLRQRNRALNANREQIYIWDEQLSVCANIINDMRIKVIQEIQSIFNSFLTNSSLCEIDLEFKQGWTGKNEFFDQLKKKTKVDIQRGYTTIGPHRADLKIRQSSSDFTSVSSRGQQKLIGILLILSAVYLIKNKVEESPILLLDDIFVELDRSNASLVMDQISSSKPQIFMTSIDALDMDYKMDVEVFHVEQGKIV